METCECTVAANSDQGVNAFIFQMLESFDAAFGCSEFFTTRGFQNSATPLENIAHRSRAKLNDVTFNHPFVAPHDSKALFLIVGASAHYGTDSCIHSWGIPAGCKDPNSRNFIVH